MVQIEGRYVIGCDGGRSRVRKSMDVAFDGFTYPERFLILSTPYDFGQHGYAFTNYIADPDEWFALFKVPGIDGNGLWRVVSPVDPTAPEAAETNTVLPGFNLAILLSPTQAVKPVMPSAPR